VLGNIENGDAESAQSYLKNLLHEYEASIFKYICVDNSAINSILNLKISRCHANKIDIKVEVESDFSHFNDIDLCVLIANLLDNAIEASYNVDEPQISVTIKNNKNYLCITIKNRIDTSVLDKNEQLKTTKSDKSRHGFGLYSIAQIVEKYDGMKSFYEKNGCFVADIWLKRNAFPLTERINSAENYQTRHN
jgi:sensor histidine kinase YesM